MKTVMRLITPPLMIPDGAEHNAKQNSFILGYWGIKLLNGVWK